MNNGEILSVKRSSDDATFSVGEYLKENGGITIMAFEYQWNGDMVAVFSDNKIGLDGLRKSMPDLDGWIDCNKRLPNKECIALDKDGEQWIGNLWKNDAGMAICEFANPNGDSQTIKIVGITHWREKIQGF